MAQEVKSSLGEDCPRDSQYIVGFVLLLVSGTSIRGEIYLRQYWVLAEYTHDEQETISNYIGRYQSERAVSPRMNVRSMQFSLADAGRAGRLELADPSSMPGKIINL